MTNEQILRTAIEKASKNGWDNDKIEIWLQHHDLDLTYYRALDFFVWDHDFAKAFWGDYTADTPCIHTEKIEVAMPIWQYHLQQMVLEEEPIKYLEKFL